jgi:beta-lactamase superfamily II metal-dependent hydrolase
VTQPFTGQSFIGGAVTVAGPTENYYKSLLAGEAQVQEKSVVGSLLAKAAAAVRALRPRATDPGETLTDDEGGTSPRNNTSVILNVVSGPYRLLFTGDAGAPALTQAHEYLQSIGATEMPLDFFDMPHHGSRHNVTDELLDKLLGSKTTTRRGSCFVSVGMKAEGHPRAKVANAVQRRGYPVVATKGLDIRWSREAPPREGYGPADPLPWFEEDQD